MSHARDSTWSLNVTTTRKACVFWLHYPITDPVTGKTANTLPRLFGSSYSTGANAASLSDSCRRSEVLSESTGNFTLMTHAKNHWCLLVFRCVNCGRNEAFAEDSFDGEPREDQIRPKSYQAICRHCGWEGEVRGLSAVEMRSGVERRKTIRNERPKRPKLDT